MATLSLLFSPLVALGPHLQCFLHQRCQEQPYLRVTAVIFIGKTLQPSQALLMENFYEESPNVLQIFFNLQGSQ